MTIAEFIAEQPAVLAAVLREVPPQLAALGLPARLRDAAPVTLVGSGTSRNALVAAEPSFIRVAHAELRLRGPLTFLAETRDRPRRDGLGIFLSQTGTSTSTLEAVRRARAIGLNALTLTAERDSPIGAVAAEMVVMPVGPEPVGPKTKGYTASVLTLLLLAHHLAGTRPEAGGFLADLSRLIPASRNAATELAALCTEAEFILVMGQGRHYATALEGSLKLSEMAGIAAAACETEEAFHGRFHGLGPRSVALFIVADAAEHAMAADGAQVLEGLGVRSRILNPAGAPTGPYDIPLAWPRTEQWPELDLISAILPLQWLACDLARRRGLAPERMRYPDLSRRLGIKTAGAA
jgi:fructoselysine-6-P-deglycase FrlB-like protein